MRDLADLTERASGRETKVYMLGTLLEILAPLALTFFIDSTSQFRDAESRGTKVGR